MTKTPALFSLHAVRYQVTDVARAAAFYTDYLGFTLDIQHLPAFASVSLGGFILLLTGPGASGSRPMPTGETQQPGGWNRVAITYLNERNPTAAASLDAEIAQCIERLAAQEFDGPVSRLQAVTTIFD
jgi:catechol 2,3-dioxygenase-like lactoylglutathione lyase family enzyme